MKLAELLPEGTPGAGGPLGELEIRGVQLDSRAVRPGDLFIAVKGSRTDGHDYLATAARSGAAAALVEREIPDPPLPVVRVPSTAKAVARAAVAVYADPSARLRVSGITGTNGKTTVAYLLEGILQAAGRVPAVLGTVDYRVAGKVLRKGLTTPFAHELQAFIAESLQMGATDVVMEVSSHSAAQGRIEGVRFDVGIFTNLSRDHLDFHGDMESYFAAKARFFREYLPAGGKKAGVVLNGDDRYGERLAQEIPSATTFGFSRVWDVYPTEMRMTWEGTQMAVATPAGALELRSPLIGAHNVSNILAAVAGALLLAVPAEAVAAGVASVRSVPGRLERIENDRGLQIYVDYAHTPDGMDRVLGTLRGLGEGRLITVFGCGGNRDRGKRPEMGKVAALRSSVIVVTSDNPRDEDPEGIIADILPGLASGGFLEARGREGWHEGFFVRISDRKAAIEAALSLAEAGDTVAIVGKGHEDVQIIGDRRLPFDDRQAVRDVLAARR